MLYDPCALTIEDEDSEGEHRYVSIGLDAISRILVIVYAQIGDDIRLISARKAGKNERCDYEERI